MWKQRDEKIGIVTRVSETSRLTRIHRSGGLDYSFGDSGTLLLDNSSNVTTVFQGTYGNLFVCHTDSSISVLSIHGTKIKSIYSNQNPSPYHITSSKILDSSNNYVLLAGRMTDTNDTFWSGVFDISHSSIPESYPIDVSYNTGVSDISNIQILPVRQDYTETVTIRVTVTTIDGNDKFVLNNNKFNTPILVGTTYI